MPVATGGARPDIIGIGTAPVLTGSTHTSASAVMAVAGIARARAIDVNEIALEILNILRGFACTRIFVSALS